MNLKWVRKILFYFVGVIILGADARSKGDEQTNNPYAVIVTRNIFDLQPPPAPDSMATPASSLPKIALNGVMSVYGSKLALIKVTLPRLGVNPVREKSYILKEGEMQDAIKVKRVDEKAGIAVFDNHGTVQEIKLGETPKN